MKKTTVFLFTSTLLAMSSVGWGSNFYVGLGAGPDTASISQRAHLKLTGGGMVDNIYDKENPGLQGAFISAFGGYGYHYQNAYLAGELNFNASSIENKSSNQSLLHHAYSQTIYKIPTNYGISLLPGYQLSQYFLGYGRVGFSKGHFIADTSDVSLQHINKWLNGWKYGLGLQAFFSPSLSGRLEWSHINYQNKSMLVNLPGVIKYTKLKTHTNQFEFGIVYNI